MDNLALDSMGFDQIKKLVGQLATAVNKLASERPAKVETETETEEETEEVIEDKCGGGKKEMTADKCGGKKPAKDTDTVKEEAEVKTEEIKAEKKKPAKAEKKEDSEELAEGEEIVKVEEVKKPVKDKEPEDLEETEETEEIKAEETEEIEEPEEKPAKKGNQGMRSDLEALKTAGLDSAPAEVKRCFIAAYKGPRYTDKETEDKKQAEKMAADSDDDVKEFYLKLFEAAQDVRPTLGDIKIGAYDSAEAIYQEACKKLNLKCTEFSAQDVYNNFKQKTQKPVVSSVSREHKISGRLESLLNQ